MSEQRKPYMQQLDDWMEANIVSKLVLDDDDERESALVSAEDIEQIKTAIRQKVLESYTTG